MREIKFRAWNTSLEFMQYGDGAQGTFLQKAIEAELPIMQYTGLKDKNGKEIYEGDIVRDLEGTIGVVEFKHGKFQALDDAKWDNLEFPDESEIIGNIYEDPNLLT